MDNSDKLNLVTTNSTTQLNEQLNTDTMDVKGVMKNNTQTPNSEVNDAEHNESKILLDLVINNIVTTIEVNTTEDKDEAAALLQLSKSDTIPDEYPELPLGVLPVDAAPVPITLGKQDVLNAIENFKKTNGKMEATPDNSNNTKPDDPKKDNNEKENNNKDKKDNNELQSTPESSPLTSSAKGSLVIVEHGI